MPPTEDDILDILRALVAFPTVSSESNLPLIAWVEQYLDRHQVPHWRVNACAEKASLLARIGPEGPNGIVLSGHTDVVPVVKQPWSSDPFVLTERAGKFFGRGTSDMKSFLALALAFMPYFTSLPLTRPIWLAFSHDEEIGCLGAPAMAQALLDHHAQPSLVVIGEPTRMQLIGAHKGICSFETIVTGREAHSSMPEQGVNAVMVMGELIACLNRIAEESRGTVDADFANVTPYASVHIGVVEGGVQRNIVPRHCRMLWEVRPLPGTDMEALLAAFYAKAAELEAQMQRTDAAANIHTRPITNVRGLQKSEGDHLALACRLANANAADAVAFGTEGGIFQGAGLPVVVCGPGSIDQAHQPDEYIEAAQLTLGAGFMQRVGEACIEA